MSSQQTIHTLPAQTQAEIECHMKLTHVPSAYIHDASKPVLQTDTDLNIKQQANSSQSTLNDIKATLSSAASSISNKINELGNDIFASSSAANMPSLSSTPAVLPKPMLHTLPNEVRQEVLFHPQLHHVSSTQIHDASKPVLSTMTDSIESQPIATTPSSVSTTLSSTATVVVEKLETVGATLSQKADQLFDRVLDAMSPTSSNVKNVNFVANTTMPSVIHTLPAEVRAEVLSHPNLHHVSTAEINDHSAPIVLASTDVLQSSLVEPTKMQKITNITNNTVNVIQDKLPTKQQVTATLSSTMHDINDALPSSSQVKSTLSSTMHDINEALPSSAQVKSTLTSTMHDINEALPSSEQVQKTLHNASETIQSTAHVVAEKLAAVGSSISSAYTKAMTPKSAAEKYADHTLNSAVSNEIKFHQPHLHHVDEKNIHDASVPVIENEVVTTVTTTDINTNNTINNNINNNTHGIAHHNIGISTPSHPHVELHPGKLDLSHVHSTIQNKNDNLFSKQQLSFNNSAYEVNEGGLAWSVPLNTNNNNDAAVNTNTTTTTTTTISTA